MTMELIGQRLRAYRREAGLTQESLAEKAGLHPTYIGQIERGEKNLTVGTLEKLLNAMSVSFSDFFAFMAPQEHAATYADRCYELLLGCSPVEQEKIYKLLLDLCSILDI